MRKSLNREIRRLLIRYYNTYSDNSISDSKRERRLKSIKLESQNYPKSEISATAKILSRSEKRPYIFKVWCDIVVLTGEV